MYLIDERNHKTMKIYLILSINYHSFFSSRFTDSKRYEASFDRCFDLDGEIRVSWTILFLKAKNIHVSNKYNLFIYALR